MNEPSAIAARELAKVLLSIALAFGSLAFFRAAAGKSWETSALRRAVVAVTIAKAILGPALYLWLPVATFASDAARFYLPETLRWLTGELPYRDFRSAYAPLFHVLLMPGVLTWPNPGSVVATIFALEVAMIALYAHHFGRARPAQTWRVLFLYCFSPISCYWVAVTGYNSVLVALFALIALLLADAGRDRAAGWMAVLGLAFTKLTVVLAWPAIVFFPRGSTARRIAPLLVLAALAPVLVLARFNLFSDALQGRYSATSGNVWFLLSLLLPEGSSRRALKLASMLSLVIALSVVVTAYLRRGRSGGGHAFDRASAFYSACVLVFMLLSYKTFPWYFTMCLIFLLHTLAGSRRPSVAALIPFATLGCLTTLEAALSVGLYHAVWRVPAVVAVDLVVLACVAYYAWLCIEIAVAPPGQ